MRSAFAAIVLCLAAVLFAASAPIVYGAERNPLKKAQIGDWIEITIWGPGKKTVIERHTVVKKTEDELALERKTTIDTKEQSAEREFVSLKTPWIRAQLALPAGVEAIKQGEGIEKISVKGQDYICHWVKHKAGKETLTVWRAPDVPLDGLVKAEIEIEGSPDDGVRIEITGSGNK